MENNTKQLAIDCLGKEVIINYNNTNHIGMIVGYADNGFLIVSILSNIGWQVNEFNNHRIHILLHSPLNVSYLYY